MPKPSGAVQIAYCAEHGLHGERAECFECGKPAEQIPMVSGQAVKGLVKALREIAEDTENGPEELGEVALKAILRYREQVSE